MSAVGGRGVLQIWIIVGQGPTVLAVGEDEGCADIFLSSVVSLFFLKIVLIQTPILNDMCAISNSELLGL